MTFTVADGNTITFDYTVQLGRMAAPLQQQKTITRQIFTAPGTARKYELGTVSAHAAAALSMSVRP